MLSIVCYVPLAGALAVILYYKSDDGEKIRRFATWVALLDFLISLPLWWLYQRDGELFQFRESAAWIDAIGVRYEFGVDGIAMLLVLLTTLLGFISFLSSWSAIRVREKEYYVFMLLLQTGMLGVFMAMDFFLFYVFWEVMLMPMYFLIGIWGGPRREYAAIKFFLYTLLGSILMLIVMLALYFNTTDPETGGHTFNMLHYMQQSTHNGWLQGFDVRILLFLGLFIGFAIKVPLFPFHTWLPDAHVEAPTAISVILAGILLKMGTYGLMRISFPMFPDVTKWFVIPMAILGAINIVYGALCAMAQSDLKKLVAYSSVSHMGFCLLGMAALTPAGMVGASFQMFSHGMITSMLFFLVGVVYDRAHHRDIDGFGGLGAVVPVYTFFITVAFFASLGLPGFSGFVAEAMVLIGSFGVFRTIVMISAFGIIIVAAFHLWALQRVFLGPLNPKYAQLEEINAREIFCLSPLALMTLLLGVYPMPVLNLMSTSLNHLVDVVKMVV
ncbi:MAG: NADH-quinone oxidoreductase subunit M [Deltaproteobacteria bacterium]|nr:NADH-quinone oxidoreductase subunit M [Deltaproteobacteria bacterium]